MSCFLKPRTLLPAQVGINHDFSRRCIVSSLDVTSFIAGRNGGHLAPYTFGAYTRLVTPLTEGGAGVSSEEAVKIIRMERDNYAIAREIVEKEGLDVDLWCGEALDGMACL